MSQSLDRLILHLLGRVADVQRTLGTGASRPVHPTDRFADLLDSMGMVEFLALVADDCRVTPEAIEQSVGMEFGTVAGLAAALQATGIGPRSQPAEPRLEAGQQKPGSAAAGATWLVGTAVRLPRTVQPAAEINAILHRPPSWLEGHAGIVQRRFWAGEDPLAAAAAAGRDCVNGVGFDPADVGALLVTSEAPPFLAGLAAALHHRLGLRPAAPALEVGGACTGFLAVLWLARHILPQSGAVLVIAVEAPTRYLMLQPGPAGEAAALFGDGAAACLLCDRPATAGAVRLTDVVLGSDGGQGHLIQVDRTATGLIELRLDGGPLAGRAVRVMAQAVRQLAQAHGLAVDDLQAVVAHGGNGRMPALLARRLGLAPERVWSETAQTGNLGAASLPVAWATRADRPSGPVLWTSVGAGLTWAAALTGS
jgi:3-oxoacyl-[acyl-carrier-protein] synthase-3